MDAEDLAFNNSSDAKIIEDLGAVLPWVCVSILSNCLVVEAVDRRDLSCFMVASQQGDVRRVLHFKAQQQLECLN